MLFRVLQCATLLCVIPMMLLGLMLGLSGGGLKPIYQRVGARFLVGMPVVVIACLIFAEILWRNDANPFAYIVILLPFGLWISQLAWVQYHTRFFFS